MKKILLFSIFLSLSLFFMQACTEDIVPSPATVNAQFASQTTVYYQNFDSSATALPTGWVATPSSGGWKIKNSNPSYTVNSDSGGYVGASGLNNLDIGNATGTNGTFSVTSNNISTTNYSNITLMYGARNSSHFADSGSVMSFYYSLDNGTNFTKILYNENAGNSDWSLINNGVRIVLPAIVANQPNVMFKWTANLVSNSQGSYRIDDFYVYGTSM